MKRFYTLLAIPAFALATSAQAPEIGEFSDYTGSSFTAHWNGTESTNLTVFSVNKGDEKTCYQDFSGIIKDAAIDSEALAAISPAWTVNVSGTGSDDVAYVNGKDRIKLDADGEYVGFFSFDGFVKTIKVGAFLTDAEGITEDNASYLQIDLLMNDGTRMMYGSTFVTLFGTVQEYDFADAFNGLPNVSAVRIVLVKDEEHNVGNIVIDKLQYEYDTRNYLLDNKAVEGTSYTVDGCDPEEVYYYYVGKADKSEMSAIATVDGFLAPAPLEPSDVTSTSYIANWDTPHKALEVFVTNYKVTTYDEEGEYTVFADDFSGATEGTFDEPVEVPSLDDITKIDGWDYATGAGIMAEGMIGTNESPSKWPPRGGYLYSPYMDLSQAGGIYTISTKIYGIPGDKISIFRENSMTPDYMLYGNVLEIGEEGYVEATWTMDDGIDNTNIHFESKGMKKFFIDYLYITQTVPAGTVVYTALDTYDCYKLEETSHIFDGLEENGVYAFSTQASGRDMWGYDRTSEKSEFKIVDLKELSGIKATIADESPVIDLYNGTLRITSPIDAVVKVYDLRGRNLAGGTAHAGDTITLPVITKGVIVVSVGKHTFKLIN